MKTLFATLLALLLVTPAFSQEVPTLVDDVAVSVTNDVVVAETEVVAETAAAPVVASSAGCCRQSDAIVYAPVTKLVAVTECVPVAVVRTTHVQTTVRTVSCVQTAKCCPVKRAVHAVAHVATLPVRAVVAHSNARRCNRAARRAARNALCATQVVQVVTCCN